MIFAVILIVVGIVFLIMEGAWKWDSWAFNVGLPALLVGTICIPITIGACMNSMQAYGRILAYDAKAQAYETAIDQTIQEAPVDGGLNFLANMSQSTNNTDMIREYRDLQTDYYGTLGSYKVYLNSWVIRRFIAKPPPAVKAVLARPILIPEVYVHE